MKSAWLRLAVDVLLCIVVLLLWRALRRAEADRALAQHALATRVALAPALRALLGSAAAHRDGVAAHVYAVRTRTRPPFTLLLDLPDPLDAYFVANYLHAHGTVDGTLTALVSGPLSVHRLLDS